MKVSLLELETVLITKRTVVRRFREHEGKVFFRLLGENSPVLDVQPMVLPPVNSPEEAEFFVRDCLAAWLRQEAFHYAIWDKESADLIGYVAFSPIDWSLPKAAVTGFIDKDRQGNGYMSEVLLSLFPFAFRYAGLEKLTLLVSTENTAAQRLARKCGFQREGDLREEIRRKSGEPVDLLLFGLTKSAYEKV
ncbi:MAG: hypothetical protein KIPDCIKN_01228 [Haliscomenobacter sp.]|jgi:RimJ/RimL family protein N-acetyltransferase|nr:hypothetical protein [Haliscomenobacter sp.]